jgi:hypothetical protein
MNEAHIIGKKIRAYGHESLPLQPRHFHRHVMTSLRHSQRFCSCSNVVPSANENLDGACLLIEMRGSDREVAVNNGTSESGEVMEIKRNRQQPGWKATLSNKLSIRTRVCACVRACVCVYRLMILRYRKLCLELNPTRESTCV